MIETNGEYFVDGQFVKRTICRRTFDRQTRIHSITSLIPKSNTHHTPVACLFLEIQINLDLLIQDNILFFDEMSVDEVSDYRTKLT